MPLSSPRNADRTCASSRSRSGEGRSRGGAGFGQALGHGEAPEVPLLREGHLHLGSTFEGRRGEAANSYFVQLKHGTYNILARLFAGVHMREGVGVRRETWVDFSLVRFTICLLTSAVHVLVLLSRFCRFWLDDLFGPPSFPNRHLAFVLICIYLGVFLLAR